MSGHDIAAGSEFHAGGRELFYITGDKLLSVAVEPGDPIRVGAPQLVLEGPRITDSRRSGGYVLTTDGGRFLLVENETDDAASRRLHVIRDVFDELPLREAVR